MLSISPNKIIDTWNFNLGWIICNFNHLHLEIIHCILNISWVLHKILIFLKYSKESISIFCSSIMANFTFKLTLQCFWDMAVFCIKRFICEIKKVLRIFFQGLIILILPHVRDGKKEVGTQIFMLGPDSHDTWVSKTRPLTHDSGHWLGEGSRFKEAHLTQITAL